MNSSTNLRMRRWEIIDKSQKLTVEKIVKILLANRGLKTKKEAEEFLNPKLEKVTSASVKIDKKQLGKAIDRIKQAIKKREQIVVFGDYDVDGICGTAILWETLNGLGANVLPYIPHRIDEGYGLSKIGIKNILAKRDPASQEKSLASRSPRFGEAGRSGQISNTRLIITVDNGIVANDAVDFANENKIDVIITDHHVPSNKLPKAYAIVHTTKLCGTGVAYMLARECHSEAQPKNPMESFAFAQDDKLELVVLATIADLVPLLGANRTLVKYGLEKLRQTERLGLLALFQEAILKKEEIDVYAIGHTIAPRLNAMGRLEYAMNSLRLLCTKDPSRAQSLAHKLGSTNRERQQVTEETVLHALSAIRNQQTEIKKLLFIAHESYQQGVIGLVAGRLVEQFYRPTIVIAKGEIYSKASARSVSGFNIIEFIRSASELLVDVGGHPMAAGFTVETAKLLLLKERLEKKAENLIDDSYLIRTLRIDCEIFLSDVTEKLYDAVQNLAPFGMGNPEPTFLIKKVLINDMRLVGNERRHLKLEVKHPASQVGIEAIAFGMGDRSGEFHVGDIVDIVCTIDENKWLGTKKLQLKVKDLRLS